MCYILLTAARKEKDDGTLFKGCTDIPAYNNFSIPAELMTEDWDEGRLLYPFYTQLSFHLIFENMLISHSVDMCKI